MRSQTKNPIILVVDDDDMVKDVIVQYLKSFGLTRIIEAKNSLHALKLLKDTKFQVDLVLSDWEMPDVNGLTLLKAIRKSDKRKNLKFIMITSQRSMERFKISQARQWQVNAYIVKPFRAQVLADKIGQVLGWTEKDDKNQAS